MSRRSAGGGRVPSVRRNVRSLEQCWELLQGRRIRRLFRSGRPDGHGVVDGPARPRRRRNRGISPKNYQLIEHLIRKGKKQLAMLRESDVTSFKL